MYGSKLYYHPSIKPSRRSNYQNSLSMSMMVLSLVLKNRPSNKKSNLCEKVSCLDFGKPNNFCTLERSIDQ